MQNLLFGESVTVTGLINEDIIAALKDQGLGELVLVPE
ncbi:MAG: DUF512 domain-containing protein [Comamonadaceae bacterium]|nr:DUF512 domain-containing protein [Comamonadaceae bacterium]